ncbi:MAG: Nif11-like leader peptide family natural product precursor [Synechococcus sp.]|nr:Nif11-like leader peptide family natural product precursor [Synechococcus sp.]
MDYSPAPLLDALDHLCHLVEGDPEFEKGFYAASTPDEMVALAVDGGILIDAEDFRALLRSGSTEFWLVRGEEGANPIAHLQQVFSV